jgi:hypothetical protein
MGVLAWANPTVAELGHRYPLKNLKFNRICSYLRLKKSNSAKFRQEMPPLN